MIEDDTEENRESAKVVWTQEDSQRDLERRKMLVIFGIVTWNMAFYVFALLPLVKIYKFGNPYWFALANGLVSLCVGILVWKKQSTAKKELPKGEEKTTGETT